MQTNSTEEYTCPFCGRTRIVNCCDDDGRDWMGHGRGTPSSTSDDRGCDCTLGALMSNKVNDIKPMCLNCSHQEYGYCKNEQQLKSISTMFDVGSRVGIKNMKASCKYYKLDVDGIGRLIVKQ